MELFFLLLELLFPRSGTFSSISWNRLELFDVYKKGVILSKVKTSLK